MIASIESMLTKIMEPSIFKQYMISIKQGEQIELERLVEKLVSSGYEREAMVEGVGQFSIRGGIIDIYSPNYDTPL